MDDWIFCRLEANGAVLEGDTYMNSVGGVDVSCDHFQCFELYWGAMPLEPGRVSRAGSRMQLDAVRLEKRTDKATPLLYGAYATNATISAEIKTFDSNPEDGTTRHRFSLLVSGGRLASIRCNVNRPARPDGRPAQLDLLDIVPHEVVFSDLVNNTEYTMTWAHVA